MKPLARLVIAASVAACGRAGDLPVTAVPETPGVCVGGVTVSPAVIALHVGDTVRVSAAACYIESAPWRWRMSDTLVASVDSIGGLIRGRAKGSATVIARYVADTVIMGAGVVVVTP